MVIDVNTAEEILSGIYSEPCLEQPNLPEPPSFKDLREEVLELMEKGKRNDVIDDICADMDMELEAIFRNWAACREYNETLAFGEYMDNLIERFVNENCYLASK